ncbi:MAG: hypothetical protein ACHQTF_05885, partial [Gemmatimonadales bacterium]
GGWGGGGGAMTAGAGETTGMTFECPQAVASAIPAHAERLPILAANAGRQRARVFGRSIRGTESQL